MYTIQHFIDKFSVIPWYKWCVGKQRNWIGQRCAFGHITPSIALGCSHVRSYTPEMQALEEIGDKYFSSKVGVRYIAAINNGNNPRFQQKRAKDRVIAALKYAQQLEAQQIIDKALRKSNDMCLV